MNRSTRASLAAETLTLLEQGEYRTPTGRHVSIRAALEQAIAGTRECEPEDLDALVKSSRERADEPRETKVSVTSETSLEAGRRLVQQDGREGVAILNFASAKNPGGGFLGGSQAQEESLARSSGLFPCLDGRAMYAWHKRHRGGPEGPLYSHRMILSPGVPVLRDDAGALLEQPWRVAFLTAPAVNAGVARQRGVDEETIRRVMAERIARVYGTRVHVCLVVGVWRGVPNGVLVRLQALP